MKLRDTIAAYGTSEGVQKAWDTRGRGRHDPTAGSWAAVRKQNNREYAESRGLKHWGPEFSYIVYDARTGKTLMTTNSPQEASEHAEHLNKKKG